jgi:hypothetical protein
MRWTVAAKRGTCSRAEGGEGAEGDADPRHGFGLSRRARVHAKSRTGATEADGPHLLSERPRQPRSRWNDGLRWQIGRSAAQRRGTVVEVTSRDVWLAALASALGTLGCGDALPSTPTVGARELTGWDAASAPDALPEDAALAVDVKRCHPAPRFCAASNVLVAT